jgi:sec-independent protein translocase protein TatC
VALRIRRGKKTSPNGNAPGGDRDDELARMTLTEHLTELRSRLIISVVAVAIGTLVAFFLYNQVLNFVTHPYRDFLAHHHAKDITRGNLIITGPLEGFSTRLKVSAYIGLFFASPIVLWEVWRFITPGLHRNEKRYAIPFIISSLALFCVGVFVAILVFPKALDFLISVSGQHVTPLFGPQKYVNLYVAACAIFGVVFMFPIVVVFLEISGAVPSLKWRRWRRPAIVVIALIAAIGTPSNDPYSFVAMAVPLYVFYELAIIVGRILKK